MMKQPSFVRILFGWFGAAALIYGTAALVNPLAGLAFLIFLLIGLVVFVGPTAHFILARRAFASGSYKPARIVAPSTLLDERPESGRCHWRQRVKSGLFGLFSTGGVSTLSHRPGRD
jgi:hypothetical protein